MKSLQTDQNKGMIQPCYRDTLLAVCNTGELPHGNVFENESTFRIVISSSNIKHYRETMVFIWELQGIAEYVGL